MNKSIDFLFIGKSVFLGIPLLIDYFFMAFSFIIRFVLDQSFTTFMLWFADCQRIATLGLRNAEFESCSNI